MGNSPEEQLTIELAEQLTAANVATYWSQVSQMRKQHPNQPLVVDAAQLQHIDTTGIAFLCDITQQSATQAHFSLINLAPHLAALIPTPPSAQATQAKASPSLISNIGKAAQEQLKYTSIMVLFLTQCFKAIMGVLSGKAKLRWQEVFSIATQAGANAVPIVLLIGFLMGVIIAFQFGLVAQQFGAVIFVVDGIGIATLRELGPLMTAIVFAGRTGAAFAAEIGTQKVNEEINALHTFGLSPVYFLVLPRLMAAVLVMPLLTIMADIVGIFGGALVLTKFNISFIQFYHALLDAVTAWDFTLGLIKSLAFGFAVAAIGCERGLATGAGATSVGLSATSAVVTSIVWIVVIDGFFSLLMS
ncbi:ABC transporter permease [Motilimonas eburnea]|uniref:ABC transporter permease n=1 Tax=Motilimonas eburnea TaxID=1737488 RepID=UPI001E35F622|nr:MlaE family lipid ABC transporter permease subunit [Motilimonas eburnea]MCE2572648.1 MlaE family lipid ABC transporter permease subunit [Motilimonas eburnea]